MKNVKSTKWESLLEIEGVREAGRMAMTGVSQKGEEIKEGNGVCQNGGRK
jgi:hypothetical protein